jgi:hypothetical protein
VDGFATLLDLTLDFLSYNQQGALRNFLSLYNLTISDGNKDNGNGTWEELDVKNGDPVRSALFGGGTQATSMIQHVFVGDGPTKLYPNLPYNAVTNPYSVPADRNSLPQIRKVVDALGIPVGPSDAHENHFHVDFRTPTRVPITAPPQQLLTDVTGYVGLTADDVGNFVMQAQTELNIEQGETTVFTLDIPDVPQHYASVMVAQANQAVANKERAIGYCGAVDYRAAFNIDNYDLLDPETVAAAYFKLYEKIEVGVPAITNVELVESPKHGKVIYTKYEDGLFHPAYHKDVGYVGDDKTVFKVNVDGKIVRVVYLLKVTDKGADSLEAQDICKKTGNFWKISLPDIPASTASLQALIDSTGISSTVKVDFADLPNGAVGQTIGSNITLDTNAAGHNWFIDATPWDNSEYLPTSNPYEWVAKEGTAAYGKMDMLSVLLHEYGHALGIDHSADNHDYMSTTLTPGVRRMPSAEELALMQQLVAQAKGDVVGWASAQQVGTNPDLPGDAPMPLPIPLGAGFGMAFIGRMRKSSYGGASIDFASSIVPLHSTPQYAVAANATFVGLNDVVGGAPPTMPGEARPTLDGWLTQGGMSFENGTATLSEVSTSQTRLSQVFMLNEQDRYLSFTLSGTALDDLNGAPDDAFEVALLDANTGASLLGGIGLTRTDAFLNLQGDGTEHAATSVTRIDNADGSRTYRVDLTGVAKNIAVNLSFDLLGFGQDNSQVTLSDIRVSGLPQLRDEAATLAEDNLLTFDPYAQADAQLKPLLASHIVDAPTHGALTVNADGTFAYTPDLDYFGTDSFSYRLSDGPLDSNLATVSLTVTPVNDAPVAADAAVTTAEDTARVIDLRAYATDVDSTVFTAQIVTGPAHGVLVQNNDGSYSYTPDANYNGADSFT